MIQGETRYLCGISFSSIPFHLPHGLHHTPGTWYLLSPLRAIGSTIQATKEALTCLSRPLSISARKTLCTRSICSSVSRSSENRASVCGTEAGRGQTDGHRVSYTVGSQGRVKRREVTEVRSDGRKSQKSGRMVKRSRSLGLRVGRSQGQVRRLEDRGDLITRRDGHRGQVRWQRGHGAQVRSEGEGGYK